MGEIFIPRRLPQTGYACMEISVNLSINCVNSLYSLWGGRCLERQGVDGCIVFCFVEELEVDFAVGSKVRGAWREIALGKLIVESQLRIGGEYQSVLVPWRAISLSKSDTIEPR